MTLGANTTWAVQSTATAGNVNGGGFNTRNANMLTDGAATSATGNSPVFSSASYNFVANDVGHWIYIKSGTNWTSGWYKIDSLSGNNAVLQAAIGQATVIDGNLRFTTNGSAGCATTGSPTGATWSVDYSRKDGAGFTGTDLTGTTTACTSVANPFGPQMVGNVMHITAGTGQTNGWYEIVSVSVVTATLDRSAGASYSLTTYHTGGAISLGATGSGIGDSAFFTAVPGGTLGYGRCFIKGPATYTLGETVSMNNSTAGQIFEGYTTTFGDRPSIASANQPTIDSGATIFSIADNGNNFPCAQYMNITFIGTADPVVKFNGQGCNFINCKVRNTSVTANRAAITLLNGATIGQVNLIGCEIISYRGYGVTGGYGSINGCWIHDCKTGIRPGASAVMLTVVNTTVANCVTSAVDSSSTTGGLTLNSCTLYGSEAKIGTGINSNALAAMPSVWNTIIYGFVTGASGGLANNNGLGDYNDYYNNTNDVDAAANWQKGPNDQAINPSFTSASQITGTTGKFVAGNGKLVDTSKNFTTLGLPATNPPTSFIYISAGTGITAGIYGITAISTTTNPNDTLTLDINPGTNTTADKVYSIPLNNNFLPTGAI